MVKKISYLIVGAFGGMALLMCVYLYIMHSRISILDTENVTMAEGEVVIESITQTGEFVSIIGYIVKSEPIMSIDIAVVIKDRESSLFYEIPTDFVEIDNEENIDNLNRMKAGFKSGFLINSWNGNYEQSEIYIYDRQKKVLFKSGYLITVGEENDEDV